MKTEVKMKSEKDFILKLAICSLLIMALSIVSNYHVFAAKTPVIYINGEKIHTKTAPIILKGTTYVPLRDISENMGCTVTWDAKTSTVKIFENSSKKTILIEKNSYTANGKKTALNPGTMNKNGTTLVPLRVIGESLDCDVKWDAKEPSITISKKFASNPKTVYEPNAKYKTVEVSNAKEFLENIKSNTRIVLTGSTYNLSKVLNVSNPSIKMTHEYDGAEYVITNVNNLIIEPKNGVSPTLLVEPRYSNVLPFENCNNITIKGITAGHTIEKGYCVGGVIFLNNTSDVTIDNCKLYGCGTYGISGNKASNISAINTEIYECTYGIVEFGYSKNINLKSCILRDSEQFSMFSIYNCENVKISDSKISGNKSDEMFSFISSTESSNVIFENCNFSNNNYKNFKSGNVEFVNCNV